jgi:hypothetical protein
LLSRKASYVAEDNTGSDSEPNGPQMGRELEKEFGKKILLGGWGACGEA